MIRKTRGTSRPALNKFMVFWTVGIISSGGGKNLVLHYYYCVLLPCPPVNLTAKRISTAVTAIIIISSLMACGCGGTYFSPFLSFLSFFFFLLRIKNIYINKRGKAEKRIIYYSLRSRNR